MNLLAAKMLLTHAHYEGIAVQLTADGHGITIDCRSESAMHELLEYAGRTNSCKDVQRTDKWPEISPLFRLE